MPHPHRPGDPWEMMELAVSSLRLLGGILLLFSALATMIVFLRDRLTFGGLAWEAWARGLMYVPPGLIFLVLAHFLARRRRWAAVAAIALTTIAFVAVLLSWASLAMLMLHEQSWMMLTVVAFGFAVVFAVGRLLFHLTKTFDAMRQLQPRERERSFEPILPPAPPLPVSPLPPSPSPQGVADEPPAAKR